MCAAGSLICRLSQKAFAYLGVFGAWGTVMEDFGDGDLSLTLYVTVEILASLSSAWEWDWGQGCRLLLGRMTGSIIHEAPSPGSGGSGLAAALTSPTRAACVVVFSVQHYRDPQ